MQIIFWLVSARENIRHIVICQFWNKSFVWQFLHDFSLHRHLSDISCWPISLYFALLWSYYQLYQKRFWSFCFMYIFEQVTLMTFLALIHTFDQCSSETVVLKLFCLTYPLTKWKYWFYPHCLLWQGLTFRERVWNRFSWKNVVT